MKYCSIDKIVLAGHQLITEGDVNKDFRTPSEEPILLIGHTEGYTLNLSECMNIYSSLRLSLVHIEET